MIRRWLTSLRDEISTWGRWQWAGILLSIGLLVLVDQCIRPATSVITRAPTPTVLALTLTPATSPSPTLIIVVHTLVPAQLPALTATPEPTEGVLAATATATLTMIPTLRAAPQIPTPGPTLAPTGTMVQRG